MTPSLTPGLSLTDNLLLTEELPAPPGAAYRVWFALNVQLGQLVVIKVHADGRVEPIENNPVATDTPVVPPIPETSPAPNWNLPQSEPSAFVAPAPVVPPTFPSAYTSSVPLTPVLDAPTRVPSNESRSTDFPVPPSDRKEGNHWLRYGLAGILLLGGAAAGYFYRKPLLAYAQSFRSGVTTTRPDSASQQSDSTAQVVDLGTDAGSDQEPAAGETMESTATVATDTTSMVAANVTPVSPSVAPITAQQATRLLSLMPKIPSEKHRAIFTDARQAFTNLRRASGRQSYIDSLYTVCMGRGAQSCITYQQNGDPVSKRYAIDWYQTAYALKPGPALQERITRLINGAPQRPKSVKKSAKRDESLFMPDPEVNQ